jgi:hypothetical protein
MIKSANYAGLRIRIRIPIGSGFNGVSGSGSGFGIRIRIQEGKNDPQKKKTLKNSCFEVLDGLFCELKASSVTWTFFMEALG